MTGVGGEELRQEFPRIAGLLIFLGAIGGALDWLGRLEMVQAYLETATDLVPLPLVGGLVLAGAGFLFWILWGSIRQRKAKRRSAAARREAFRRLLTLASDRDLSQLEPLLSQECVAFNRSFDVEAIGEFVDFVAGRASSQGIVLEHQGRVLQTTADSYERFFRLKPGLNDTMREFFEGRDR